MSIQKPHNHHPQQAHSHLLNTVNEGNTEEEEEEDDMDEEKMERRHRTYSDEDLGLCCCTMGDICVRMNNAYHRYCSCGGSSSRRRRNNQYDYTAKDCWRSTCRQLRLLWLRLKSYICCQSYEEVLLASGGGDRDSYHSLDGDIPFAPYSMNRTATISVEYLKSRDKRPVHLAWTFFAIYVVRKDKLMIGMITYLMTNALFCLLPHPFTHMMTDHRYLLLLLFQGKEPKRLRKSPT